MKAGYIFVNQDVRGRFMSEGEFVQVTPHVPNKQKPTDVDESSDTYDTIEWLLKNIPGHNGRVGMYGISYPGFYASAGMIDAHPALEGRLAAGPGRRLVLRRLPAQRGVLPGPRLSLAGEQRHRPGPSRPPKRPSRSSIRTPDGYQLFLEAGSMENDQPAALQGHGSRSGTT